MPAAVRPYMTVANVLYLYLPFGYLLAAPKLFLFMLKRRGQVLRVKKPAKKKEV